MKTRSAAIFWGTSLLTAAGVWYIHTTQVEEREVGRESGLSMIEGGCTSNFKTHVVRRDEPRTASIICTARRLCSFC